MAMGSTLSKSRKLSIQIAFLAVIAGTSAAFAAAQPPRAPADATPAGSSTALPEVIIRGRAELEPKVTAFVNKMTEGPFFEKGLARWHKPVCLFLSGVPDWDTAFVFDRISDIAREAGVRVAGNNCRPNLFIYVTPDPAALLRDMEKHNNSRIQTFGGIDTSPSVIDQFISTPRAVRIWYRTAAKTDEDIPVRARSYPSVTSGKVGPFTVCGDTWIPGFVAYDYVWAIYRVFVIVDERRMQGVSREQLADYVAMVGLAQIKINNDLGDAPTILKLFDVAPQAAPAGMSDWDRTFLKSLYVSEQISIHQRTQIVHDMVNEMVH